MAGIRVVEGRWLSACEVGLQWITHARDRFVKGHALSQAISQQLSPLDSQRSHQALRRGVSDAGGVGYFRD
ncbi:MAG: hypothetical protein AAF773_00115 [Cyanobacteria bacterium P01_D01_bin.115]